MARIEERVAALEAQMATKPDFSLRNVVIGVLLTGLVMGGGWWVYYVTTNLTAIKQQLRDGGAKELVSELTNPASEDQLRANLSLVAAQANVARLRKVVPTAQTMMVSDAVAEVLQRNPGVTEAWQAAAQLIAFRIPQPTSPPPRCLTRPMPTLNNPIPGVSRMTWARPGFDKCTLDLNDVDGFVESAAGKRYQELLKMSAVVEPLRLVNVYVIYHGGPVIPVRAIEFENCTFNVTSSAPASPAGRSTVTQLLQAKKVDSIQVNLPEG